MKNIIKAVVQATKEIQAAGGVEKNSEVGSGSNAYKGIKDADVKKIVGRAMVNNGLAIFPIHVDEELRIERWEAKDYRGNPTMKQQVFSSISAKYLLCHESGESIELSGRGHGIDSQDKAIGKAETYSLKYVLLHTFLVESDKIDDTDTSHSDDIKTPPRQTQPVKGKPKITAGKLLSVILWAKKKNLTLNTIADYYTFSESQKALIVEALAEDNFMPGYNMVKGSLESGAPFDQEQFDSLLMSENIIKLLKTVK